MKSIWYVTVAIIIVASTISVEGKTEKFKTPAGFTVKYNQKVSDQYEQYWDTNWEDINWENIDRTWFGLQDYYYNLGFKKAQDIKPKYTINIHEWSPDCVDENGDPNSKEFRSAYGCIDGLYPGHIHLGDDDGQGADAFCNTAISHEMAHWWVKKLKIKGCFWGLDDLKNHPECTVYDPGARKLGLCKA